MDCLVKEGAPTTNYGSSTMLCASICDNDSIEADIGFQYVLFYRIMQQALIQQRVTLQTRDVDDLGILLIYFEDLASDWIEYIVTWDTKPFGRGIIADHKSVESNGQVVNFDITSIVRNWFNGKTINHGLRIYVPSGNGQVRFHSRESNGNEPYVVIEYEWCILYLLGYIYIFIVLSHSSYL